MTESHHSTLVLRGTGIRQDSEGRFCLNDLHRASGYGAGKRPSNWLRIDPARELVEELKKQVSYVRLAPIHVVHGGPERGTYVARELVYAYAMWISPAFHLAVIRAFDAAQSGRVMAPAGMERPAAAVRFRSMDSAFRQMMKVAMLCGCTRRQAAERAALGVKRHWGINPLEEMGLLPDSSSLFDQPVKG